MFQFLIGRLAIEYFIRFSLENPLFQFLIGRLAICKGIELISPCKGFQFLIGRLAMDTKVWINGQERKGFNSS